ncbi:hypothetical protein EJ03DRAFT_323993, partial [Teratosphaeria nubilosa]
MTSREDLLLQACDLPETVHLLPNPVQKRPDECFCLTSAIFRLRQQDFDQRNTTAYSSVSLLLHIAILLTCCAAATPPPSFVVAAGGCNTLDGLGGIIFDPFPSEKTDSGCRSIAKGTGHSYGFLDEPRAPFKCTGYVYNDNSCHYQIGSIGGDELDRCAEVPQGIYSLKITC